MNNKGFAIYELIFLMVWVLGTVGWIANIVKLIGMDLEPLTMLLVLRVIGVIAAPLGAVLGFI